MDRNERGQYLRNMTYAASAGTSGCSTVILVIGALLLGLWLDALLGTQPALTLLLVLLSIPLSLVVMLYTVLNATSKITPPKVPPRRTIPMEDEETNRY
jgi:hypothetical protein